MQVKMISTKVFLSSLLLVSFISLSHAEYVESDLKNLFTTKKERTKIDAKRFGKPIIASVKPQVKKKIKIKKVTVSGYMKRSNGESVVWLNGKNTLKRNRIGDVSVKRMNIKDDEVAVNVGGKTIKIKPGETWLGIENVSDPVK